eukprot:SAG31_NODE_31116_length_372_cov_0.564103_1_plen_40_part_01
MGACTLAVLRIRGVEDGRGVAVPRWASWSGHCFEVVAPSG